MKGSAAPKAASGRTRTDFSCRVAFNAPRARVFNAIATIGGLRNWWTPLAGGSAAPGGQLRFEFDGVDECIVMQVDHPNRPDSIHWTCLLHTGLVEWAGTKLTFDLVELTPETCNLRFRHLGLTPKLTCYRDCQQGWEHFLASLVAYVERGKGMPFGARKRA